MSSPFEKEIDQNDLHKILYRNVWIYFQYSSFFNKGPHNSHEQFKF